MEIRTNHKPRPIISGYELTARERAEFDYMGDIESGAFFRYRGAVYNLGEFMRACGSLALLGFDGIAPDTYFSATLIKIVDHGESVICARAYS